MEIYDRELINPSHTNITDTDLLIDTRLVLRLIAFKENLWFQVAAIFHSPPPPSLVLWLPFLRSALNKLFSAIMANTIQSGARSLFNLISRVLISPIYLLEATWSSIVTPFLTAKKSHLYKIRHPQKDQRPYLCWNTSQTSTACLMSGKLPGGCVHITHAHVLGCSAVTDGSV